MQQKWRTSPAEDKAKAKTEAKGRAMLAGRRVPKSGAHGSPKLARGYFCMAALQ
jgi:hypothetical protein